MAEEKKPVVKKPKAKVEVKPKVKKEKAAPKYLMSVKCSVCKKDKKMNPMVSVARLEKYGSVEKIEKEWICKDCTPKKEKKIKPQKEVNAPKKNATDSKKKVSEETKAKVKKITRSLVEKIPLAEPVEKEF